MEVISRRLSSAWLACAPVLFAACGGSDAPSAASAPPASHHTVWKPPAPVNVVLILVDTLRADAVYDDAGRYDTPNLDRLVQEGVVFPRAFSAAPMTLPSHMSLFSSRPPLETHVVNNGQKVPHELPLFADWLEHNGYDTRAVISLGTLNPLDAKDSPARGFDDYDTDYWDISSAARTKERVLASLERRQRTKPLFLFSHFADPHEPYDAHGSESVSVEAFMDGKPLDEVVISDLNQWSRELVLTGGRTVFEFQSPHKPAARFRVRRFECTEDGKPLPAEEIQWELGQPMDRVLKARVVIDRGDKPDATCQLRFWINDVPASDDLRRNRYALEVAYVDQQIGELIAALDRQGLYQDSLVVFTSDHGEALGEHALFGHVERLSDDMIHVPLIVKLPRNDPRKAELEAAAKRVVSQLDLVPTLLEIAGVGPLPGQRGLTLFEPHDALHVAETHRPEAKRTQFALRDARFKMVYFPTDPEAKPPQQERFELYDLDADPGELEDVFARRAGERPEWPKKLRLLHERSLGHVPVDDAPGDDAEDRAREETLRALGYGGAEDNGEDASGEEQKDAKPVKKVP